MQPLLTSPQIKAADAYTIEHEPTSSVDLMERAAKAFVTCIVKHYPDKEKNIAVYCGTGNNGGDGLAIARLLHQARYKNVKVKIARFSDKSTGDFYTNLKRLRSIEVTEIHPGDKLPEEDAGILIDGLLGTGLNKPLTGAYKKLVDHLNSLDKEVIAIDIPTGFMGDGEVPADAAVLKANLVITFQQPKINFLLPESAKYMDDFVVADIGIKPEYIRQQNTPYQLLEQADITSKLKLRRKFTHKGTYGHALIIAGQPETMGAALLCSSACAHTGAGLTTACIPESGLIALNTAHPEVMAIVRKDHHPPKTEWNKFSAIAIGPGLGKHADALNLLQAAFAEFNKPMVIDADALNLVAENHLLEKVPANSILTPHMKEFDRLFGEHRNWWGRIEKLIEKAKEFKIYIVLKNQYTIIGTPQGMVYFNPTGNPAMASGGMGDVLTGVIASLLAQGYLPEDACLMGVYLHGMAGDDLALPAKLTTVVAGEVAKHMPVVMAKLKA
ncbi:bifunctional ADP-dependent (S)-NAD(P)H-hydrate dehydratase/NAD(P)H-hydrate epimerase [Mucilaginibacter sp. PPCGB 2223]|uniref:NAD(P)H-hydrate dehydratase n=1 Tax=Mucilaginibacter sp. PPCGB 2223 TaxID=1886027 RepID=UPI000824E999|nr:NAD(P)H-hydrate dehydratase [Mucilaginibacter sp. PPCGB 2223]OCX52437.1 bifunctional ADP-dependent (S)-NAD(P)H-hydrate dehydratase/NAD(P)H-hydrate epimerase [Mucilaginibacter sp. PPCGB 2223]